MIPWEREVYLNLLHKYIREEKQKQAEQKARR